MSQSEEDTRPEVLSDEKGKNEERTLWVYTYIDMMAGVGQKLHMEAFESEEDAISRDKELEFGANKLKMIEDRRLSPVRFKRGWADYFLFRKRVLKRSKKEDKKTKKALTQQRNLDRDEHTTVRHTIPYTDDHASKLVLLRRAATTDTTSVQHAETTDTTKTTVITDHNTSSSIPYVR
jgi:hypothetical protein